MVYDSNRDRVVLFGGNGGSIPIPDPFLLNDTWELPGSSIALTDLAFPSLLTSTGTAAISFSGPSPIGGITVSLSADDPLKRLEIPESVLVAEGRTSADFPVNNNTEGHPPVAVLVTARFGASNVTSAVNIGQD